MCHTHFLTALFLFVSLCLFVCYYFWKICWTSGSHWEGSHLPCKTTLTKVATPVQKFRSHTLEMRYLQANVVCNAKLYQLTALHCVLCNQLSNGTFIFLLMDIQGVFLFLGRGRELHTRSNKRSTNVIFSLLEWQTSALSKKAPFCDASASRRDFGFIVSFTGKCMNAWGVLQAAFYICPDDIL